MFGDVENGRDSNAAISRDETAGNPDEMGLILLIAEFRFRKRRYIELIDN